MRTIACLAFKGGTGKSTTALALAVGIAQRMPKAKVLLVDHDPQSDTSRIMEAVGEPSLADVLLERVDASEAVQSTRIPNVDIIGADGRLADCTAALAEADLGRERRLAVALESIESEYDYCIVDSPGQFTLLTVNVLQACADVVCPINAGSFAVAGIERLELTIERVRHYLQHPKLGIIKCLITQAAKTRITEAIEKELRQKYKSLISQAVIPWAPLVVEEAHSNARSVLEWAPRSAVAKAYGELVTEVLNHGKRIARNNRRRGDAA
jgi:chromosome partitioning protein